MRGRSLAATLPAWVAVIRRRLDARPESRPRAASPGGSTSSGACCCWWPRSRCTCCCRRLPRCSDRAGRAHAVHGGDAARGRGRRRPGGSGAHRVDRPAARDHATLPLLALPAIIGGAPISHGLASAAYLGIGMLLLLVAAGAAAFATDRPLQLAGRGVQWLLNHTIRRRRHVDGLPQQLLADRDFIRTTLGGRWKAAVAAAAGNTGFDYLALLCTLRAVGAAPRPSLVLLAYTSADLLALLPFTPGGLGFVEAGLVGTLRLAGVPGAHAVAATLLYRLVAYWLPIPAGGVAYLLFRRRYH